MAYWRVFLYMSDGYKTGVCKETIRANHEKQAVARVKGRKDVSAPQVTTEQEHTDTAYQSLSSLMAFARISSASSRVSFL